MDDELAGVAIIGMAGQFPGAQDIDAFWANLLAGKDTITRFAAADGAGDDYVAARGVLDDAAMFDAEYFGIAPREADRMDPQHRIFLEACSNALEDAGYVSETYAGEIGLFAGCSLNTYLLANLAQDRGFLDELTMNYQVGEFAVALGNDKDFLTTRVAYKLNLRGPVVSVQSACATSLVAVCQAAQALLTYGCDMALAGGVSVTFPQERGHVYQEGGIVSRDGHCRPFDAEATGTVFGHGVGVVVLKRLDEAVRDGDRISAVIRGFAVNNDGSAKAGYMAPGVDGQARVIAAAQAMAGVAPETITYVEAHGTGTPLGDPVEIAALTRAFRAGTEAEGFCVVGTAKGNVGHLDSAAGVTGLIKTALSLQHRTLPGLKHFRAANANIELAGSPFVFRRETTAWEGATPLRAGVSAFGVGGVNAHVVLEEAPVFASGETARERQVLCVSGRTEVAARRAADNLAERLERLDGTKLADIAFTLACGRKEHAFRLAVVADETAAAESLRRGTPRVAKTRRVAFLFSGQGTQFIGMGRALYDAEPVYREAIEACAEAAREVLGGDLRDLMFGADEATLERTEWAQPAIFATGLALATLWESWGVRAEALLGHSLGEYVAATLAGVFSREDAMRLVCLRGQRMGELAGGAMLSVALGEEAATGYVGEDISLAAVNGPRACVLSGTLAAIDALEARLGLEGIAARRLRTSHAFHSAMMIGMLAAFEADVARVERQAPRRPILSSVTGTWMTDAEATSTAYWAQQCVRPVRFADALQTLTGAGVDVLLEVGAGETLTMLAMQNGLGKDVEAVSSLGRPRAGGAPVKSVRDALAQLWSAGVAVDWQAYYANERRGRVSLPTYPFERKLHWIEPPARQASAAETGMERNEMSVPATSLGEAAELTAKGRDVRLREEIAVVLTELSGIETTAADADVQFLELGFDSLFLTQATQALSKRFGVKLTFRQLMEQFSNISSLANHLDAVLPAEMFAAVPVVETKVAATSTGTPVERMLADQLAAMQKMFSEQVAALRSVAGGGGSAPVQPTVAIAEVPAEVRMVRPGQGKVAQELTVAQERYIANLVAAYAAKTPGSKRLTQDGRRQLADPRAVAGFRPQWKEMVYPLITERALGSRLWDVDGNEYIDVVNGYGCILFGHSPEFVVEAARAQLERGVAIGPQTPLASEVAALLCELTGNERVTFCNTGSEAVMAAIRVARTVTGRDKFVYFGGDYHGTFDEVLVRQTPRGSAPVAPGIPTANVTNVVVLEYGAEASLAYLREHADEIAAVLIEPVQTRHPDVQPFAFIRAVRELTERTGTAFILDEVVTGFRLAPGGMQEFLGIRADLCTYGKVIGGGHPIGVLSGKAHYLDALDGGAWQFGDDSGPEVGVTFFAGTFVRHPLALAAARAVLLHLRGAGAGLQKELNAKTARLAESLDRFFVERGVPSRIYHFASWFYFTFPNDTRLGSLLYYAMRLKGIHIQEGYPCFLTTAHTDADFAAIEQAFRETVIEMQAAGVLPASLPEVAGMHPLALAETPLRVPLTAPQREVFLAAALNDEANCAFNESLTLHLRGDVREADLLSAVETVLARHDALRSTVSEDGEWLVVGDCGVAVEVRDADEDALHEAAEREAVTPFDLVAGPLMRAVIYRVSASHFALMLTAHHLVLDGWSANQVLDEMGRLYSRGARAEMLPLLPFSSYAVREAQRAGALEFSENEAYWVGRFAGRSPRLEVPTDRPRPLTKSYRGSTSRGAIGPDLTAKLKAASKRAGCTLYVTLLSGFELLLHRLTGQDELVVGISTAGQALVEGASLVGHCVHFLPMLSVVHEAETTAEHLRATRTVLLDAYDHQEFTFGSMLGKLKLEREPGRLPLIEVQFNLEKVGGNVAFDGLAVAIEGNDKRFVNTDLFLNVMETETALEFTCDYNTDLFDEVTVARWMEEWETLLASAAGEPSARVDELEVLSSAERAGLLLAGDGPVVGLEYEPVTAAFLRMASAEPMRVSVECGARVWTYGELAGYARRLAGVLVGSGLRPGGLVGIAVERSPEMVGAVLAVMLAGGAYVPLDPKHPKQRLEGVLADAGVEVLLVGGELGLATTARVLRVDGVLPEISDDVVLPEPAGPEALAYVIYTSGSTGVPKGVAVEHGSLGNLLGAMRREPGLGADDVLVAVTTLAFDIAGLELLLPLVTGARLVIATEGEVRDGRLLLERVERAGASVAGQTVLQATPGAWRLLLDAGWEREVRPLKALCGGEALPRELAERILDRAGEVWNMYGPTETTIWSSATRVAHGRGALRLGRPIANTQFYVLDARRQLVPTGVTGELYIGGAGVARGYWHRAELTTEKFVRNPFAPGRMYATGDLARRHEDGTIELLGRADFQVKIRGYRIELAEIEAALTQHEDVREAVVVQEQGSGRLIGYVATRTAPGAAAKLTDEFADLLGRKLPDYMVPGHFVVLAELPRTPNGKIDRKALLAGNGMETRQREFTPPATPAQAKLAEIWAEVLEQERVSVTDSIFELGADSLVIFRIAARAQREGLALNATQIFQHRTIAGICRALEQDGTGKPVRVTTRITAAGREQFRVPREKVDA